MLLMDEPLGVVAHILVVFPRLSSSVRSEVGREDEDMCVLRFGV
jgi:hypothetical protein